MLIRKFFVESNFGSETDNQSLINRNEREHRQILPLLC